MGKGTVNRQFGQQGEQVAARYLAERGYRVLAKNWLALGAEIDLVMRDPRGETVFVEVKTRHGAVMGYPEESVTLQKRRHILRAAEQWVTERKVAGPWRVDVVAITIQDGASPDIVHFEGV